MAKHLTAHGEFEACPALLAKLERISVSTVRRILARIRQDQPGLPRRGPERVSRASRGIPMKRIPWDEGEPGHFEVDWVHHAGARGSDQYVHTLQMVDVATGWSERAAVLGRSYCVMEDGFLRILARLPFRELEIHLDNGSEFFNHHLLRFWGETVQSVQLSRSRPFHKPVLSEAEGNDNRFVEQKNASLVRAYLGGDRLDTMAQTLAVNRLYATQGRRARIRRCYDEARTPFDRLSATNAVNGRTENVHETLAFPLTPHKGEDASVTLSLDRTTAVR